MTRVRSAALAVCAILLLLAVFQVALIAGAPLGQFAWGGREVVLPIGLRIGSAIAIGIYAVFALLVLDRTGVLQILPDRRIARIGVWVVFSYLLVGTVANFLSESLPERLVMTPTTILLAALVGVVALG